MKRPIYQWEVSHEKHGTANVAAPDKLRAVQGAAKTWKVPWSGIARECRCRRMGLAEEKK